MGSHFLNFLRKVRQSCAFLFEQTNHYNKTPSLSSCSPLLKFGVLSKINKTAWIIKNGTHHYEVNTLKFLFIIEHYNVFVRPIL